EEIIVTEERLGTRLPPSYRNFLKVTNGLNNWHLGILGFYPVNEVNWFSQVHENWINIYLNSSRGDARIVIPDEAYFVYGEMQETYTHILHQYM
ncbi:MAG: SMI1/KNR4 family protein, partial [Cyanothece sp. SIO2G6]|nr:SMI1/KNR4 family protein [Cyanothece sp. SIO2G6]